MSVPSMQSFRDIDPNPAHEQVAVYSFTLLLMTCASNAVPRLHVPSEKCLSFSPYCLPGFLQSWHRLLLRISVDQPRRLGTNSVLQSLSMVGRGIRTPKLDREHMQTGKQNIDSVANSRGDALVLYLRSPYMLAYR
jgi:hypothetical protein